MLGSDNLKPMLFAMISESAENADKAIEILIKTIDYLAALRPRTILNTSENNEGCNYSYKDLWKMDYNKLVEEREKVRQDSTRDDWRYTLDLFDSVLSQREDPIREYSMTLSDEELEYELNKAEAEYHKNGTNYNRFYQLKCERGSRYAKAHPERFPRIREHGYNLYKDE